MAMEPAKKKTVMIKFTTSSGRPMILELHDREKYKAIKSRVSKNAATPVKIWNPPEDVERASVAATHAKVTIANKHSITRMINLDDVTTPIATV